MLAYHSLKSLLRCLVFHHSVNYRFLILQLYFYIFLYLFVFLVFFFLYRHKYHHYYYSCDSLYTHYIIWLIDGGDSSLRSVSFFFFFTKLSTSAHTWCRNRSNNDNRTCNSHSTVVQYALDGGPLNACRLTKSAICLARILRSYIGFVCVRMRAHARVCLCLYCSIA